MFSEEMDTEAPKHKLNIHPFSSALFLTQRTEIQEFHIVKDREQPFKGELHMTDMTKMKRI